MRWTCTLVVLAFLGAPLAAHAAPAAHSAASDQCKSSQLRVVTTHGQVLAHPPRRLPRRAQVECIKLKPHPSPRKAYTGGFQILHDHELWTRPMKRFMARRAVRRAQRLSAPNQKILLKHLAAVGGARAARETATTTTDITDSYPGELPDGSVVTDESELTFPNPDEYGARVEETVNTETPVFALESTMVYGRELVSKCPYSDGTVLGQAHYKVAEAVTSEDGRASHALDIDLGFTGHAGPDGMIRTYDVHGKLAYTMKLRGEDGRRYTTDFHKKGLKMSDNAWKTWGGRGRARDFLDSLTTSLGVSPGESGFYAQVLMTINGIQNALEQAQRGWNSTDSLCVEVLVKGDRDDVEPGGTANADTTVRCKKDGDSLRGASLRATPVGPTKIDPTKTRSPGHFLLSDAGGWEKTPSGMRVKTHSRCGFGTGMLLFTGAAVPLFDITIHYRDTWSGGTSRDWTMSGSVASADNGQAGSSGGSGAYSGATYTGGTFNSDGDENDCNDLPASKSISGSANIYAQWTNEASPRIFYIASFDPDTGMGDSRFVPPANGTYTTTEPWNPAPGFAEACGGQETVTVTISNLRSAPDPD